jgi:hypothetical protein
MCKAASKADVGASLFKQHVCNTAVCLKGTDIFRPPRQLEHTMSAMLPLCLTHTCAYTFVLPAIRIEAMRALFWKVVDAI